MKSLVVLCLCGLPLFASSFVYDVCSIFQWEALQVNYLATTVDGVPTFTQTNTRVSYDYNNSRVATTSYRVDNQNTTEVQRIYDYKQKTVYTIEGLKCTRERLETDFKQACVPQNFSYTWMRTYYGEFEGPDPSILWVFEFQGDVEGLHYIIQTSWNSNPVLEHVIGTVDGAPYFSNTAFVNMTGGIRNPKIFVPPSSCQQAEYKDTIIPDARLGIFSGW